MGYKNIEQKRKYQREWLTNRRSQFFANKSCVKCGSKERLELDHIDPSTKVTNNIWSWSQNRREAEIAKCQVLCHDCHVQKTYDNLDIDTRGEKVHSAKLTKDQVIEARKLHATGQYTFRQIGDMYKVHRDTIRYLVNRGGWRHITN